MKFYIFLYFNELDLIVDRNENNEIDVEEMELDIFRCYVQCEETKEFR